MVLVRDVMRRGRIVWLPPEATVGDAVKLMSRENVGSILVMSGGRIVGIFTERDLVHHLARGGGLNDRLSSVMTREVLTLREDESAVKAATIMVERGIRHLPVVDAKGNVVGMVSARDALRLVIAGSQWP